jgi:hypothetical protein
MSINLTNSSWQHADFVQKPLMPAFGAEAFRDLTVAAGSGTLPEELLQTFTNSPRNYWIRPHQVVKGRNFGSRRGVSGAEDEGIWRAKRKPRRVLVSRDRLTDHRVFPLKWS